MQEAVVQALPASHSAEDATGHQSPSKHKTRCLQSQEKQASQNSQTPPSSRRTRSQAAPEWTVQEVLILLSEIAAIDEDWFRELSSYQRWKMVSDSCITMNVARSSSQCKSKWDTLLGDYRKIRSWELKSRDDSYWLLAEERRKDFELPVSFQKEIFDAMDAVIQVRRHQSNSKSSDPDHMVRVPELETSCGDADSEGVLVTASRGLEMEEVTRTSKSLEVEGLYITSKSLQMEDLLTSSKILKTEVTRTSRSPEVGDSAITSKSPKVGYITSKSLQMEDLLTSSKSLKTEVVTRTSRSPEVGDLVITSKSPKVEDFITSSKSPKVDDFITASKDPEVAGLFTTSKCPQKASAMAELITTTKSLGVEDVITTSKSLEGKGLITTSKSLEGEYLITTSKCIEAKELFTTSKSLEAELLTTSKTLEAEELITTSIKPMKACALIEEELITSSNSEVEGLTRIPVEFTVMAEEKVIPNPKSSENARVMVDKLQGKAEHVCAVLRGELQDSISHCPSPLSNSLKPSAIQTQFVRRQADELIKAFTGLTNSLDELCELISRGSGCTLIKPVNSMA